MHSDPWQEICRTLAEAGLLVQASAREGIEALSSLDPLIEAANSSGVRLIDSKAVNELLSFSVETPETSQERTNQKSQAMLPGQGENPVFGRKVAPIPKNQWSSKPRPHGDYEYRLDDFPMNASDLDGVVEVHFDITGGSKTEGSLSDMQSCFSSRLQKIRNLMLAAGNLPRRPIRNSEAWRNRQRFNSKENEISIVGLVKDVKWTRTGKLSFVIEDESSQIECLLNPPSEASPLHPSLDGLMVDEVIGASGYFLPGERDSPLWVRDIHKPPLGNHSKNQSGPDRAVSAAFLSDVHYGSKTFLTAQWEKMIDWFNNDPLARKIKYFVLSGDGVDGVGIYPGQERHLSVTDLFKQYSELASILADIPDWVDVIMLPGNHDAVRPAEPQPALDPEVQQDYSNTTFVGNPCDFSLNGVRVLSYHGKSIDDFVATLRSVSYSKPEMAMRAMLERRHLAPSWGGKTPLSPEPEDRLVIPEIPDIFVTGHVHGHFVGDHKGTTLVHSSTWQDQTDFQRMLGFQPKPCILTVVNLHTFATASIPFN